MDSVQALQEWYELEKKKGLVDVDIFPSDLTNATVESVAAEFMEISKAIDQGLYTPFEENF